MLEGGCFEQGDCPNDIASDLGGTVPKLLKNHKEPIMPNGGFLVKFGDKDAVHCASIELDYDSWEYKTNGREATKIPVGVMTITVQVEEG